MEKSKEKIRAAIIGLGRIASLLEDDERREKPCTHAGAITANPDCVLAGGCDKDDNRRRLFAKRWSAPVYADASEMIRSLKPQILVIATNPDSHYQYCSLASAAKIPVIICEKPLADTISAAKKIVNERRGIIIINHERRYSADYMKAREIIAGTQLGTLLSVRAVLYMGKKRRILNALWDDGTHLADAIMFLTGRTLIHCDCWGTNLNASTGTAWLEGELVQQKSSAGGKNRDRSLPIPVVIETGAGRDHLVFEIEFSFTNGRLRIGNGVYEIWESGECPYAEKFRSLKLTDETFTGPTGYFANMIADAAACVRNPNRRPSSSADDGLAVIEYLDSLMP